MRNHLQRLLVAGSLALGMTAIAVLVAPLGGQAQAQTAYRAPRAADGHADLNGIWQAMNSAHYDIEPHTARAALQLRPGPYGPLPAKEVLYMGAVGAVPGGLGIVDGGQIPYKPEMLAKRKANQDKWAELDPEVKCYLPGVPRATYMPFPFQIFQSHSAFFVAYEYAGGVRNVYLKDPGPAPAPSWMGQSVGHWEGDTFVIVANGFNDQTWFDRAGNFHSDQMKVTERYTPTDKDHLLYEATIEDSVTFTKPWKISMPLYRRVERDAQLMEFKCVEFVEELMYGQWRKTPLPR
jgi:hypothetical protein